MLLVGRCVVAASLSAYPRIRTRRHRHRNTATATRRSNSSHILVRVGLGQDSQVLGERVKWIADARISPTAVTPPSLESCAFCISGVIEQLGLTESGRYPAASADPPPRDEEAAKRRAATSCSSTTRRRRAPAAAGDRLLACLLLSRVLSPLPSRPLSHDAPALTPMRALAGAGGRASI